MMLKDLRDRLGRWLANYLQKESSGYRPYTASDPDTLRRFLRPGDVLLVEGAQKISTAIKYLTQSTWSHAAMYVGDRLPETEEGGERLALVEVELGLGTIASPLEKYASYNTRICRPVGLDPDDREKVVRYMIDRLGTRYDLKNIVDLARYLLPTPPVPVRWRRRLLALGSGSPTRAICSTMIAQAFQSVRYPILPHIEETGGGLTSVPARKLIYHIRHHSLFTPRDFDLSPYFRIIKPTVEGGFDYKALTWAAPRDKKPGLPGD